MRKMVPAVLVLIFLLTGVEMASAAPKIDANCYSTSGQATGRKVVIEGKKCPAKDRAEDERFTDATRSKTVGSGPKLKYRYYYTPLCKIVGAGNGSCIEISDDACPNGDDMTSRALVALNGPRRGQILKQEGYCGTDEPPSEIPNAEDDVARLSAEQFRKLPIASAHIQSQPRGFSLLNGFAHIYAKSSAQTFTITLFEQTVRVRAIPTEYIWQYGDGTTRSFGEPGMPIAEHSFSERTPTSHVYKETGDFQVRLNTRFRGEYSTEGGPWTPVPGSANVPSEPMPMSVWRTKKLLVDQNCAEDPNGPACDSPFLKEKSPSK